MAWSIMQKMPITVRHSYPDENNIIDQLVLNLGDICLHSKLQLSGGQKQKFENFDHR